MVARSGVIEWWHGVVVANGDGFCPGGRDASYPTVGHLGTGHYLRGGGYQTGGK